MQKHPELPQAFADLGVSVPILKALRKIGYETPSDIQREMIPVALSGRDILGQARTGTGKTASFGIPALQRIDPNKRLQALCLAPTRELAVQVTGEIRRIAEFTGVHCVAVYGGQKIQTQVHQLGKKPHFVIGTPGRVMDMIGRRHLDIHELDYVILDEVDRMLDIGFRDDIRKILGYIRSEHQTIFVSATFDDEIRRLAKQFTREPVEINVSRDQITVDQVQQFFVTAEQRDKFRLLKLLLEQDEPEAAIVFTNTKHAARKLAGQLHKVGIEAMEIHGDLMQRKRDKAMERFRKHRVRVLVATDLAARGIDVQNVTHIINYDLPVDIQVYVHRIGRTARMGAKGKAVSFVTREEGVLLTDIEKMINREIVECSYEGYTPSPPPERPKLVALTPGEALASRLVTSSGAEEDDAPRRTLLRRYKPARRRR
ncbi:MAG: DEAD/DEAH box helicase [Phycisphaerales bacterium]|nr:DEAD/DEAH box helicase [Phycisphaerales bacterium]